MITPAFQPDLKFILEDLTMITVATFQIGHGGKVTTGCTTKNNVDTLFTVSEVRESRRYELC
jgi:hypothetical protein